MKPWGAVPTALLALGIIWHLPLGQAQLSPGDIIVADLGKPFSWSDNSPAVPGGIYRIRLGSVVTAIALFETAYVGSTSGLAILPSGDIVVSGRLAADPQASYIFRVRQDCAVSCSPAAIKLAQGFGTSGVAVDASGDIIAAGAVCSDPCRLVTHAVLRIPRDCASPCTPHIIKSGPPLSGPTGVAIDASGNIIVANNGPVITEEAGPILSIPPNCDNTCMPKIIYSRSPFRSPWGVAIDRSGNIIVADYRATAIFRVPADCNNACAPTVVKQGKPLQDPLSVAVDIDGNIIVADFYVRAVFKIPPDCANACTPPAVAAGPSLYGPVAVAAFPPATPIPEYPHGSVIAVASTVVVSLLLRVRLRKIRRGS